MRTRNDLLALAGRYATQRRVPVATIIKEILHYEILFALNQSGAAALLTFQGGTSLRLCYQGNRYSEDLDFVGGADFDPAEMAPFSDMLQREIGEAYGLEVDVSPPKSRERLDADGQPAAPEEVAVARWRARVQIPQPDPSAGQRQIIHIEVASVPAHTRDLMPVAVNYDHLPGPLRQMLVVVETLPEILADKLVALGARPYLKARDVWDLKFLRDRAVALDPALVAAKLADYRLSSAAFRQTLQARVDHLASPDAETTFIREMSRFVDNTVASQLAIPGIARRYLDAAATCARPLLSA